MREKFSNFSKKAVKLMSESGFKFGTHKRTVSDFKVGNLFERSFENVWADHTLKLLDSSSFYAKRFLKIVFEYGSHGQSVDKLVHLKSGYF